MQAILISATCIVLCGGCSKSVYLHQGTRAAADVHQIVEREMAAALQLPQSSSNLSKNSGQQFFILVFPGLPFDVADLSFSEQPQIYTDLKAINQAYRFALLTDDVKVLSNSPSPKAQGSLKKILIEQQLVSPTIDLVTSPTYNDSFLPAYPNPQVGNSSDIWTRIQASRPLKDSIMVKGEWQYFFWPNYNIDFSVARINIERGRWQPHLQQGPEPVAIVKGIVLIQNVTLITFDTKISVFKTQKIKTINTPSSSLRTTSPLLIGYIYEIL